MARTIKVTVKNGKPTIETTGFTGTSCLDATAGIERLLAGEGGVEVRDMNGALVDQEQYQSQSEY